VAGKAAARIHPEDGRLLVEGTITYDNIVEVTRAGEAAIKTNDIQIDLEGITEVDSSAVSMLLEWTRTAQMYGRKVEFVNLPGNLADLVELYDVGNMVPVCSTRKNLFVKLTDSVLS